MKRFVYKKKDQNIFFKLCPTLTIYTKVDNSIVSFVRNMVRFNEHMRNLDNVRERFKDGTFFKGIEATPKLLEAAWKKL